MGLELSGAALAAQGLVGLGLGTGEALAVPCAVTRPHRRAAVADLLQALDLLARELAELSALQATDGDGGGNPAARGLGLALVLVVRLVRMGDG